MNKSNVRDRSEERKMEFIIMIIFILIFGVPYIYRKPKPLETTERNHNKIKTKSENNTFQN